MFLPRNIHFSKTHAPLYIFLFIAPIFFRLLYGVPPVPTDYVVNIATVSTQSESANAPQVISHQILTISPKSQPSSESSNSKRLAPFKTFKNKIIKDKSINLAESLDPTKPKIFSTLFADQPLLQEKRYLTTHSNAPPLTI
jgi:hypothetical protein